MNKETNIRLDNNNSTIVFNLKNEIPELFYIGKALPLDINIENFISARIRPQAITAIDQVIPINLHPENSTGFKGYPAMKAYRPHDKKQDWAGRFEFIKYEKEENELIFFLEDIHRGLALEISCKLDETGVVIFNKKLTNIADTNIMVDWLSAPVIPILQHLNEYVTFQGRWCGEFNLQRRAIHKGITALENRTGITSHEIFPGVLVATSDTNETQGECLAAHLGWSSNHKLLIERTDSGETQLQMGILQLPSESLIKPNQSIKTPELYLTYSNNGFNDISFKYHSFVRKNILSFPDKNKKRPVTYNTWEAIYFDHQKDKLEALADNASKLGAERFVLDDGWFKGRNDDTSSLGDWFVDERKYPNGLNPLIDYVNKKGMEFGLWIEPEMVNENSDLYREHPDWALQLKPYPLVTGRNQLVLDLSNKDVFDYLYERISSLLSSHNIAYLKWDMNRILVLAGDSNSNVTAFKQNRSYYKLLDKVKENFPLVEIESCAAGGGRIDYEVLKRVQRFWPSDSNDAVERMSIQMGFSYFFPPEVMGAHIGEQWTHTSGRGISYSFQAITTSYGHFGIEMDITKLNEEDSKEISNAIEIYKKDRDLWHHGRFYRIRTIDESLVGVAVVSENKKDARVVVTQLDRARSTIPPLLKIPGLNRNSVYKIKVQSRSKYFEVSKLSFANPIYSEGIEVSGMLLSDVGIQMPLLFPQYGLKLLLEEIE